MKDSKNHPLWPAFCDWWRKQQVLYPLAYKEWMFAAFAAGVTEGKRMVDEQNNDTLGAWTSGVGKP